MNGELQKQIADYQAISQQAKSAGRKLAQKLESLGWAILERIVDEDGSVIGGDCPAAFSPELQAHKDWNLVVEDDNVDGWNIDALLVSANDWSDHIVRFPVIS